MWKLSLDFTVIGPGLKTELLLTWLIPLIALQYDVPVLKLRKSFWWAVDYSLMSMQECGSTDVWSATVGRSTTYTTIPQQPTLRSISSGGRRTLFASDPPLFSNHLCCSIVLTQRAEVFTRAIPQVTRLHITHVIWVHFSSWLRARLELWWDRAWSPAAESISGTVLQSVKQMTAFDKILRPIFPQFYRKMRLSQCLFSFLYTYHSSFQDYNRSCLRVGNLLHTVLSLSQKGWQ